MASRNGISGCSIRAATPTTRPKKYVTGKAIELYQNEYAIGFPAEERPAGRPAKTTALYEKLRMKGAMFCARGGWERAAWFPRPGDRREWKPSFQRTNWHGAVAEECAAVRERVGILDLGGFTETHGRGRRRSAWLDQIDLRKAAEARPHDALLHAERQGRYRVGVHDHAPGARTMFYLLSAAAAEWHDIDLAANASADATRR